MRLLATTAIYLSLAGLCLYGMLFVYSSTIPPWADADETWVFSGAFKKQCVFYLLGCVLAYGVSRIPYRRWRSYSLLFYITNLFLLVLLRFFGQVFGGARSWFAIGDLRYQPSETMKIAWALYLAEVLRHRAQRGKLWGLTSSFLATLVPVFLILIQPDLGTACIFVPALTLTLYATGARKRHLALAVGIMVIAAIPLWHFGMKEYQKDRLRAWLDPKNKEQKEAYQLRHSLLAVADGSWFGKGLGQGEMNRLALLPERHTDFIFSVIAEELGLFGALGLIAAYGLLVLAIVALATYTREPYGKVALTAIASIIFCQAFINLAVALGIIPTTGLTLPLVSAGGSSVVATSVMVGLALSIARHPVTVLSSEDYLD